MAHSPRGWTGTRTPSGLKRVRQAERREAINAPRRTKAKTLVTKTLKIAAGQVEGDASVALAEAMSALDKAAKVGALHPNTAARRKSRLARKVAAAIGGATVLTAAKITKTTGAAAAAKAAKARIAAGKAEKAKGAQTAAGKAKAAIARFRCAGIPFEISGGVSLRNIAAYAKAKPDRISIGALTHSAPALDMSVQLYQA